MITGLSDTVATGSLVLALPIAALAGLFSFFSPCVIPLLPGYLSYVTGIAAQDLEHGHRGRMVLGSTLFVLGFTTVFVAGGSLFGALGGQLLEHQRTFSIVMGVVVIVLGLAFMGFVPFLQREVKAHAVPAVGLGVAPLLGALFGLGWIPCVSPTLGAVLTLAGTEGTAARGALLSTAYCLGLGLPFIAAAFTFERFMRATAWIRRHQRAVMLVGGGMLVVVGLLLVTGVWNTLVTELLTRVGTGSIPI
ncbi:MAG: cytochrome c biogenesis CcdA family protein [Aeromicrobium sp.]